SGAACNGIAIDDTEFAAAIRGVDDVWGIVGDEVRPYHPRKDGVEHANQTGGEACDAAHQPASRKNATKCGWRGQQTSVCVRLGDFFRRPKTPNRATLGVLTRRARCNAPLNRLFQMRLRFKQNAPASCAGARKQIEELIEIAID